MNFMWEFAVRIEVNVRITVKFSKTDAFWQLFWDFSADKFSAGKIINRFDDIRLILTRVYYL